MKKTGFALGGGGARGFAHLGAVKALGEKGIQPDIFSGTSAGSIVAALLAAGKSPDEVMAIMQDIKLTDAVKIKLPVDGFASLDNLAEKLDDILQGSDFSDLAYPLIVCVANLSTGKVEYVSKGNVAKAVQASSSIPILFSPVEINGQLYVDGGLLDNVPVKPLINQCERIIAIDISPVQGIQKVGSISDIMVQVFQMSIGMQPDREAGCDLLIRMDELADFGILDTSHNQEIYDIGYEHVRKLTVPSIFK